jgi:hypothetical protein
MDPVLIGAIVLLLLPALYFLFRRPTKVPSEGGRPDHIERPELTGAEQHKHRKIP